VRARLARAAAAALVALTVIAAGAGCHKGSSSAAPEPSAVDAPVVRADSADLLLTWIDEKGDFHVETRVEDVPMTGRDAVRVEDPLHEDTAHPDTVFIVDLRQAGADGRFPVRTMSRADFEAMAVAHRDKAGPTLANAGAPPSAPPPEGAGSASAQHPRRNKAGAVVVIYGAEWCGACHEAAKYLRAKGIAYVDKDVEKDPAAAEEMQQKLAKNGLRNGSIPVIDVRGKVMVGFNPAEIDAALGEAL
jgi:glutaredoxin